MVSGFCSSCGAAKVSPNAQFCHICGASLDPGGQAKLPLASPLPTHGARSPAISPGRATGATIGAIFAALSVGMLALSFESGGDILAGLPVADIYNVYGSAIGASVGITVLIVIGSFCYGILRLTHRPFMQTWLEALGIGSVAFFFLYGIGVATLYLDFNHIYDPKKLFLTLIIISSIVFNGLGTFTGVGIASGFARWRLFRPQAIRLSLEQIIGMAFGPLFLIFAALLALLANEHNDPIFYVLFLPMLSGVAIFVVPFIARGIALDRLRRVRPDLFL